MGERRQPYEPSLGGRPSSDVYLGGEQGILHLVEFLSHEEASVRERALFALAETGDSRAVQGLLRIVDNRRIHPRQRARAAKALGNIQVEAVFLALLERLNESNWYVRWQVTLALGRVGDERAVLPLLDILDNDLSSFARQNAAIALGRLRSPSATTSLIVALSDHRVIVREAALDALLSIGTSEAKAAVMHYREQQNFYD